MLYLCKANKAKKLYYGSAFSPAATVGTTPAKVIEDQRAQSVPTTNLSYGDDRPCAQTLDRTISGKPRALFSSQELR
jgi:hypothetical protein